MATKLTKKQTKAVLADAKKLKERDKANAAERGKKLTLSKDFKPTVPARTPPKDTSKRPSSRAYANNRGVIDSLVEPEKVPVNNPSTMSGSRDSQRQAFSENKTGISKNYKVVDGKMVEIDEAEWKKAAQKFVKQEGTGKGTIKKGQTVANAPKPSRADIIKGAVAKVQGKRGLGGDLSAAERKMAREGVAPARAPATPPTPKPAAPAVTEAPKAPATSAAPKMTRAERSAANKAKHAEVRAAEEKKWADQKTAKKADAPKAATKPKTTAAKPAAPAKTAPASTAKKTTTAKPAAKSAPKTTAQSKGSTTWVDKKGRATTSKQAGWPAGTETWTESQKPSPSAKTPKTTTTKPTKPATKPTTKPAGTSKPKINPERAERMAVKPVPKEGTAKPATPLPQAAKPAPKSWMARNLPNVSTVLKEGLASKVGRQAAASVGKNFVSGALSRGNLLVTGLTYSPDAGNKAADDAMAARLQAKVREGRRAAAAKASPATTASKPKPQTTKPAAPKKTTSQAPKKQTAPKAAAPVASKAPAAAPMTANPDKAIADFEAKLRAAGVVSIAGGAGGKAQMVQQPMSVTQLEDQFKRKKGPR